MENIQRLEQQDIYCPNCKSKVGFDINHAMLEYYIKCKNCGRALGHSTDKEYLLKKWNEDWGVNNG